MKKSLLLILFPTLVFAEPQATYQSLIKAKVCKDWNNQLNCKYDLGKSFSIEIAGIGQADASIVFMKSDFDGDYYGKVGVLHNCVIVIKSKLIHDMAFISPKNGKVYQTWPECADAK